MPLTGNIIRDPTLHSNLLATLARMGIYSFIPDNHCTTLWTTLSYGIRDYIEKETPAMPAIQAFLAEAKYTNEAFQGHTAPSKLVQTRRTT